MKTLQELVNLKNTDNSKYKIEFGNIVMQIYQNNTNYQRYLKNEPEWGALEQKEISLIVSNFSHLARITGHMYLYSWLFDEKFILERPYFALDAKGMLRVVLLQESPFDYRRNNIFVSANVLTKV